MASDDKAFSCFFFDTDTRVVTSLAYHFGEVPNIWGIQVGDHIGIIPTIGEEEEEEEGPLVVTLEANLSKSRGTCERVERVSQHGSSSTWPKEEPFSYIYREKQMREAESDPSLEAVQLSRGTPTRAIAGSKSKKKKNCANLEKLKM